MLQKLLSRTFVWRKMLLSLTAALIALSLLVYSVLAQSDELETPTVSVQPNVAAANVVQTVPVTLTLTIPSPTGSITVEVPVFLSLDIRIGISPQLTTTVAVTPSVVTEAEITPAATLESVGEATEESTVEATTEPATATPIAPVPTDTPIADEVVSESEPTEVPLPTATPTATATVEPVVVAPACADPRTLITSPGSGQVISGMVQILGTATHENFLYYKVEYAPGENVDPDDTFSYLADARVQVVDGLLAAFDSANFANNPYTIKLTVVDNSGNFPPPCTVSVVIQN